MKTRENISNLFSIITLIILIGGSIYLWSFISKLGYKIGGRRGYSKSITDSQKRKVFIKTLGYEFKPNYLKIDGFKVYIEKGFKYGEKSYKTTDSLGVDKYPYQLVLTRKNKWEKFGDTIISFNDDIDNLRKYKVIEKPTIRDTLYLSVLINRTMYEIDTIGVVKVY